MKNKERERRRLLNDGLREEESVEWNTAKSDQQELANNQRQNPFVSGGYKEKFWAKKREETTPGKTCISVLKSGQEGLRANVEESALALEQVVEENSV